LYSYATYIEIFKEKEQNMQENSQSIILSKYKIEGIIGKGMFGTVYNGSILSTNEKVAIKMENPQHGINILKHETTILNHLYRKGCRCTPPVYWYGIYKTNTCLIMPHYKVTLHDYIISLNRSRELTLKKLNKIMVCLIQLLENVHKYYVVHRDIKPQNFMLSENQNLYLIDFGFATFYMNENMKHIEMESSHTHVIGNPKYMSINIHHGITPVRRDDLISLGYMYIQFIMNGLPWDDTYISKEKDTCFYPETHVLHYKNTQRRDLKEWEHLSLICKTINDNIYKYMEHCYSMPFKETPNYTLLSNLFMG
jgi:serine/threonine protein kinase